MNSRACLLADCDQQNHRQTNSPPMLKRPLLLLGISILAVTSSIAGTITLGTHTYTVTTNTYGGYSDWETAVQNELGLGATPADFATLKLDSVGRETDLWNFLTSEGLGSAYILWNENAYVDGMPIFLTRHLDYPGGSWYVMDFIDPSPTGYPNRIDLGRWDLGNQKIIAVTTVAAVPEPSAALLGGLGVLALLRRRRA